MIFRAMQFWASCILGIALFLVPKALAQSKSVVFTTIPELAWIVKRLAPQGVEVESLLEAGVNAHYVDAKPSFIMKLRKADMVCSVGLGLEGAWLDRAIERSFNHKLLSTHSCVVGGGISVVGRPDSVKDRSHGHLHAAGNPHFWYAPSRMIEATDLIVERLKFLVKAHLAQTDELDKKAKQLKAQLLTTLKEAQEKIAKNSLRTVSQYHSDFDYLIEDLGLEKVLSIESKPGVPPSTAQLSLFKKTIQDKKVKVILSLPWDPEGVVAKLGEDVGAEIVEWPAEELDYITAFETFVRRLDGALE